MDSITKNKKTLFDPSKPWEDQLVIISLENCIKERNRWIENNVKRIQELKSQGRDCELYEHDLEDEQELLSSLVQVFHYYKGQS